ncbi:MAG: integrase family protein, partial [Phycisphaerales bacterium]|nr:integrase family protein [Phycisphaerales bacterium]
MASITKQPNGRREVQFIGPDERRRTIRLGRVEQKVADTFRIQIEAINAAHMTGDSITPFTAQWLRGLSDQFHDRFVRAGLCQPRVVQVNNEVNVQAMLKAFIERRDDVKEVTRAVYRQAEKHLKRLLGGDRPVRSVTAADASDYRRSMRKDYSEAYTAKMIVQARLFWRDAVDRGLADINVFSKVPTGSQVNAANQRFIERAAIEKVIAVCPDPQWKLLIALSRYAGLRCPSEHLALKWDDIDWTRGRMTVRATKTEHHADKGIRVVPIFSELRRYLQTVFDQRDG